MSGCDAVVNFATRVPIGLTMLVPGAWRSNDRIRSHGAGIVAAAAREAGVGRLVQQSLSFVYADNGDDWIDEHSTIDLTRASEPVVVAEGEVDDFTRAGGVGRLAAIRPDRRARRHHGLAAAASQGRTADRHRRA